MGIFLSRQERPNAQPLTEEFQRTVVSSLRRIHGDIGSLKVQQGALFESSLRRAAENSLGKSFCKSLTIRCLIDIIRVPRLNLAQGGSGKLP